jgi:hypothetical protein
MEEWYKKERDKVICKMYKEKSTRSSDRKRDRK